MTAIISKIKSKADVQQLPVTHERAVRDDNGTTLETKLQMIDYHYNKNYEAGNGMGKKTLPKNNGVLTQAMMNDSNTIYVIQYDFTLGEDITVPANCVLEFDGGSISGNHTINLNNCHIEAPTKAILTGITLSANYDMPIRAEWFGIISGENVNSTIITNLVKYCKVIEFGYGTFNFSSPITISSSDRCRCIKGQPKGSDDNSVLPNTQFNVNGCDAFVLNVGDVECCDLYIIGTNCSGTWNSSTKVYDNPKSAFKISAGATIRNCRITGFGYGIYKVPSSSVVSLKIYDTTIAYCGNAGIDLTSTENGSTNHVIIDGSYIVKCGYNADNLSSDSTEKYSGCGVKIGDGNGIFITGTVVEYCSGMGIYLAGENNNQKTTVSIIGNTFERNKYTQIGISNSAATGGNITIKGNSYSDGPTSVLSGDYKVNNALPQREVCGFLTEEFKIFRINLKLILEDFTLDSLYNKSQNQKENYILNHFSSVSIEKDGDNFVQHLNDTNGFKVSPVTGYWKITESGWYYPIITGKVDEGYCNIGSVGFYVNGVKNSYNDNYPITSNVYTDYSLSACWFEVGDIVQLHENVTTVAHNCNDCYIKSIRLEKAKNSGETIERPEFGSTTGIGHEFFDTTIGKPIYWCVNNTYPNGAWVDATGTPV